MQPCILNPVSFDQLLTAQNNYHALITFPSRYRGDFISDLLKEDEL